MARGQSDDGTRVMAEKILTNSSPSVVNGADLLLAWRIVRAGARIAALLVLIAAVVVIVLAVPMIIDVLRPAPREIKAPDDPKNIAEEQKVIFEKYLAQIKGRSLFHVPVPPAPAEKPEEETQDRPPPAPTSYGGPAMVAMLSDTVWFTGGKKLKVGEAADGVEVVALRPPWDAKLKWKGVDFDVNLFERSKVSKEPPKEKAGTTGTTGTTEPTESAGTTQEKITPSEEAPDAIPPATLPITPPGSTEPDDDTKPQTPKTPDAPQAPTPVTQPSVPPPQSPAPSAPPPP